METCLTCRALLIPKEMNAGRCAACEQRLTARPVRLDGWPQSPPGWAPPGPPAVGSGHTSDLPPLPRRLEGHCCPACDCGDLLANGVSWLDNKHYWKCQACGKDLGPNRGAGASLAYLIFSLLVVALIWGGGIRVLVFALFSERDIFGPVDLRILLVALMGLVLGPLGVWYALKDFCMPRARKAASPP